MQVQDIRQYLKRNKNNEETSKDQNKTETDTNTPNIDKYVTAKTRGYNNKKKNKKQKPTQMGEYSQSNDIKQFFEHAELCDNTVNNPQHQKQKGRKKRIEETSRQKKTDNHNYTELTPYYSTQDKPPDKRKYVQQKLDTFVGFKFKKKDGMRTGQNE
eukprot:11065124-Ditylum_brightwellii.AAC.1